MYGGVGGFWECRYELMRCTKVDFPAPAMPIVIIVMGFFFVEDDAADDAESMLLVDVAMGRDKIQNEDAFCDICVTSAHDYVVPLYLI